MSERFILTKPGLFMGEETPNGELLNSVKVSTLWRKDKY